MHVQVERAKNDAFDKFGRLERNEMSRTMKKGTTRKKNNKETEGAKKRKRLEKSIASCIVAQRKRQ